MSYISIFPYILWIFLAYTVVFSAVTSDVDAQFLSGERRNNSAATSSDASQGLGDNGLLSTLRDSGVLRGNLSSVTDTMFQGIEERIDTRLESFESKLDEIAAIAVPAIIAAVAGIVAFAALIVIYIILSWFDRFKAIRHHKKALRNMYDLVLKELKDNTVLVQERSSLTKSINIQSEGENNHVNADIVALHSLSTHALETAISSQLFWDLTPNVQDVMFKLLRAVNGHNEVFARALGLKDSIILNKIHRQTTEKLLSGYESASTKYNQDINQSSKQLEELIQAEMSKGILGVFHSKHKDDEGH